MIITAQTLKGNALTVDIAARSLTIAQGAFNYRGPYVLIHEGKQVGALEIMMDGKKVSVAIPRELGNQITRAQWKIEEDRLEQLFPGLTLLKAAHQSEEAYLDAFNRMMEDEQNDGVNPPKAPALDTDELSAQYPRAALYLKADGYTLAANDKKSSAGTKAKRLLEMGGSEADAESILKNWVGDFND